MKICKYLYLGIIIFVILSLTIGFSAFNIEMNVDDIISYFKAPSEIRVTGISIDSIENNSISESEEYGVDSISMNVSLPEESSTITYLVDVTNLGGTYMVISNIKNLPDNLTYELNNYELNHILCDDNSQCTLGITKQLSLTIKYKDGEYDSTNTNFNLSLNFVFEEFTYTIYYDSGFGLPNDYQEVDYIESTGTQRINTTYLFKTTSSMELDLSFSGTYATSGGNAFFASRDGDYTFSFNFGASASQYNTIFPWTNKTYAAGATVKSFTITDTIRTNRNKIKYEDGKVTYSTVSKTVDKKEINHTSPFYLFGNASTNFSRYYMKVYRLKFFESSTLVADYVPCYRKSDGRTGLYDIIGRKFVSNIEDSEFNIGEEKTSQELQVRYPMNKQVLRYGESTNLRYNAFIKEDYMFVNWNTKVDGTGETYTNRQKITNIFEESGQELYLYAQWTPEGLLGDGSLASPYLVSNIEDFVRLSNIVNKGTNTFDNQYLLMTRNLDFKSDESYMNPYTTEFGDVNGDGSVETIKEELSSGLGFPSIGKNHYFGGSFDGGGYKLSNLYIHNSTQGENGETLTGTLESGRLALFSYVKMGTISNMEVSGSIYSDQPVNMAGIVGMIESGVIDGIKNKVVVEIDSGSGNTIGGITAISTGNSKILNSSNHAIVMNLNTTSANKVIIGGIVGKAEGEMIVRNTFNAGELKNGWRLGGISSGVISGSSHLIIDTCYNTANITSNPIAPSGENMHVGGLVGLLWNSSYSSTVHVINSYNTGTIKSTTQKDVAGLIGAVTTGGNAYIINSYNAGKTIGQNTNSYSSGIVNYSGSTSRELLINNVFNYGEITGTGKVYGIGNITTTTYTISNTYYNELLSPSSKTIGTAVNTEYFNSQEFVDLLNSNINTIDLDNESSKKLATDYSVSLCNWVLGDKGYPVLDCK